MERLTGLNMMIYVPLFNATYTLQDQSQVLSVSCRELKLWLFALITEL